jgi:HTH-type transcriptional regulator / antitoxin HigA
MFVDEIKYNSSVTMLDRLIDEVGEDETHPLASLMDVLSALIENYENANVPELILE